MYRDPRPRGLPMWQLNVLLDTSREPHLGWLDAPRAAALKVDEPPIFLGLLDGVAHFALDISALGDPAHELDLDAAVEFKDSRAAAMVLPIPETGMLAQARSQLDWHRRHRFCGVCGNPTVPARGGHVRECSACKSEHFPRTDPVAIMLITNGERCLLGQSAGRLARTGM